MRRNQISSFAQNETSPFKSDGWRQFSRLLAAEVCASAVVMLDTPCSEVVWRVLAIHCIRHFPPSLPGLCVTVRHHISTGLCHWWCQLCILVLDGLIDIFYWTMWLCLFLLFYFVLLCICGFCLLGINYLNTFHIPCINYICKIYKQSPKALQFHDVYSFILYVYPIYYFSLLIQSKILTQNYVFLILWSVGEPLITVLFLYLRPEDGQSTGRNMLVNILRIKVHNKIKAHFCL